MPPAPSDFISDFLALTEGARSPRLFRLWSGISLVAGVLERRVWVKTSGGLIFPNLYVLLVAHPGVGKFVIETVRDLWSQVREPGTALPALRVAPDSVTNASLMDELAAAKQIRVMRSGPAYTYHSLLVPTEEFQVLLPSYDQQFIASLNSIFNNKALHKEARRTGSVKKLEIENPQFNILGGAQPAYFISTFPEEAWSTGLVRRIIMVYSADTPLRSLWEELDPGTVTRESVLSRLAYFTTLFGQAQWTPEASEKIDQWQLAGGEPVPGHSKLAHYARGRTVTVAKLALVSAVSRTGSLVIETLDVSRAMAWLFEVEALMPDIFRAMIGKSDAQVIEEMHLYLMQVWGKGKQEPVTGGLIMRFLLQRVPSEKAEKIMMMAERANIIARVAGTQDLFIPRPKSDHEVE